jgi:hypothetical protein
VWESGFADALRKAQVTLKNSFYELEITSSFAAFSRTRACSESFLYKRTKERKQLVCGAVGWVNALITCWASCLTLPSPVTFFSSWGKSAMISLARSRSLRAASGSPSRASRVSCSLSLSACANPNLFSVGSQYKYHNPRCFWSVCVWLWDDGKGVLTSAVYTIPLVMSPFITRSQS